MDLATAVAKTIAYANFFNFPLSPSEIHLWLISPDTVPLSSLKKYLPELSKKEIEYKRLLADSTKQKVETAHQLIKFARFIPGIRLIAITGSVATNNSKKDDDIDLLIITSANSLWLVRPLFLLLLSIKFNRRHPGDSPHKQKNAFCPNLWLDTLTLPVLKNRRNIYTAHEVLQVKPIFDRGQTYRKFIKSNHWTRHFLANAYRKLSQGNAVTKHNAIISCLLAPINYTFFLLQYLYMRSKITTEKVSLHSAYFHKHDLSIPLEKYLRTKSRYN